MFAVQVFPVLNYGAFGPFSPRQCWEGSENKRLG